MISQQKVRISASNMTPHLTLLASAPADMIAFLAGLPLQVGLLLPNGFGKIPNRNQVRSITCNDCRPLVETALRAAITQRFPADTISGEEFGPDDRSDPSKGPPASSMDYRSD